MQDRARPQQGRASPGFRAGYRAPSHTTVRTLEPYQTGNSLLQRYKSSHGDMYSNKLGGGHEAGAHGEPTVCDLFSIIYNMGEEAQKINIEMKLPGSRRLRTPGPCVVGTVPVAF